MEEQNPKPSAFNGRPEATTVVCVWDEIHLKCEDTYECFSNIFGTKKSQFYLSGEYSNDGLDFGFSQESIWNFSLNIAQSSIKKKIFINSILVDCNEREDKPKHENKVISADKPFEFMKHDYSEEFKFEDLKLSVQITFKESVDNWNFGCGFSPIVNNAEVLCQQMANAMVSIPPDVTLKTMTDGRLFPAHKFVLKLRSSVFAAMFSGGFTENQMENPIEIFEISGQVMEAMLAYIYCKPFDGWRKNPGELAVAADMYNIQPLYKLCTNVLWNKITIENAVNNFYYADLLKLASMKLNIARFIVQKKKKIEQTESWKESTEERKDWLEKQLSEILSEEGEDK